MLALSLVLGGSGAWGSRHLWDLHLHAVRGKLSSQGACTHGPSCVHPAGGRQRVCSFIFKVRLTSVYRASWFYCS